MFFGSIASVDPNTTIAVLIVAFIALSILGIALSKFREWAEQHRYGEIFEKMERDLFQLGIVSFGLFLFNPTNYRDSEMAFNFGESFDFVHIILLYLAVAFIFLAFMLLQFCVTADKAFLVAMKADSTRLLRKYEALQHTSSWEQYTFHKNSLIAPLQSLRTHIEFKIIQRLFLKVHRLPSEFSFQKYTFHLFKVFISEVSDTKYVTWLLLTALCLVNYFRLKVIDPALHDLICPDHPTHDPVSRHEAQLECTMYYTLSYACFCVLFVSLVVGLTFHATNHYFDLLISRSLFIDNIDFAKTGRYGYKRVLEAMVVEEAEQDEQGAMISLVGNKDDDDSDHEMEVLGKDGRAGSHASYRVISRRMNEVRGRDHSVQSKAEQRRAATLAAGSPTADAPSIAASFRQTLENTFSKPDNSAKVIDINSVFWLNAPRVYFKSVEFSLFLQCMYIAVWACELMPLVHHSAHSVKSAGLWVVVLSFPIIFNFYVGSQTVNKAVLLRSICGLDRGIIGVVCDEVINESKALDDLRARVRGKFEHGKVPVEHWRPFALELFTKYDRDSDNSLSKSEFRELLEDVEVYLGNETFGLVWERIDIDCSDTITLDEFNLLLFPEFKREFKACFEVAKKLRHDIEHKNAITKTASLENLRKLRLRFEVIDINKSNTIDKAEFKALLDTLHVTGLSERAFNVLFAILETKPRGSGKGPSSSSSSGSGDEALTWEEFASLVYPDAPAHLIASSVVAPNTVSKPATASVSRPRPPVPSQFKR